MGIISNFWKGIAYRIKQIFFNRYKMVGLSRLQVKMLKHAGNDKKIKNIIFLGKRFAFCNGREFLHGVDEIFINEIYKSKLSDAPIIFDCGANIGLSVLYFKMQNPQAKIIAFEPDKENFEILSSNINAFNFNDISLRKDAVWIENTELNFQTDGTMGSKLVADNACNNQTNIVNAIRLKELITMPIDMLKIDIEGAEFEVLKDIIDKLHLVKNIFLEYHGSYNQNNELNEILQILTLKGFSYYIKEATPVYNHPFIKNKAPNYPYDVQLNIFGFKH